MITGSFTALITPFAGSGIDQEGLHRLADFQIESGITGILAVGTTGESPTLAWDEHNRVIEIVAENTRGKCLCIAGTGSNNTAEALTATNHAQEAGADAVLLVDPYYNGPSSMEIRREYVEPVAKAFPRLEIIPYIIPGRTGAQMFPEDLAILARNCQNVTTVKEATGNLDNMKRTRECCGADFSILSGDDPMTFRMMTDPAIQASGVISVVSNVAPRAVADMTRLLQEGKTEEAAKMNDALAPLYGLVTVKTTENSPFGTVECRARNPLAIKTLMSLLGMPSGGCRAPLGKMSWNGIEKVLDAARTVQQNNPEIFQPAADFFDVNVEEKLDRRENLESLYYTDYE